jgi:hypothetical protein
MEFSGMTRLAALILTMAVLAGMVSGSAFSTSSEGNRCACRLHAAVLFF